LGRCSPAALGILKFRMKNNHELKNGVSSFVSSIDLILYFLLAAAFILYGVYSLLTHLWSSGAEYFVFGILLLTGMFIQISLDLYHKQMGTVSKIVLGILFLVTIIIIIGDLVSAL
jgi:hypothetical protein